MLTVILFFAGGILAPPFLQSVMYCSPTPGAGEMPVRYQLKSWTTDNGLPQNTVNKIVQTMDGYIWLATNDGLVRFDGVNFTVFNSKNFPQLKTNRILDIIESRDGSLWIGTEGGGVTVKGKNSQNTTYTMDQGLAGNFVGNLFEDSQGRIWIVTNKGLNYLKDGSLFTFTTKDGLSYNLASRVFEDSRHNLWIVTEDAVLNRFNNGNISHLSAEEGGVFGYIHNIYEDKNQNVWFSFPGKLWRFKDGTFTTIKIPMGKLDPIVSMAEDHEGNLWAVSNIGEFYHIREGKPEVYPFPQLKNKYRLSLMVDREGLLWIGTGSSGLHRLRKVPLAAYSVEHGLSHHLALSIHQDSTGIIWVGTNGKGVSYFEKGTFKSFAPVQGGNIWATLTDSNGNHWFGTWGGGLFRVKNDHVKVFTKDHGLADNVVLALYEDREKNLWIGTSSGLTVYRNGEFKNFYKKNGFKGDFVISLLKDSRGILWAGTKTNGLNRLENGRFTNYSTRNGLSHNAVRALYEDDTGSLWIGTYGGGLNRLKNGKFAAITTEDGLYDNVVSCILEDYRGFFWMSCNRGVYMAAKQELNDFADGKIQRINCTYYNKADGMKTAECNGGFQPSGWKTTDGKLWFPTIRGVVVFDPHQVTINQKPPPVIVEKIIVDGSEIDLQRKRELPPGVKRFEFHYTGLSFPVPERVRFCFKLEGLEEQWRDVGTRRVAYYTQIPPGDYTFRVKACNNDGVWNDTGAAVSFYLKPYFYQTGWFYGLCVLAAAFLVFTVFRLRVRQLKAREKELSLMVESRTLQLAEQAEKLKEMDRVKSRFFANISHEFRTPLTLIKGPLEQILADNPGKELETKAHMMLRNSRRLLNLVDQLLELAKFDSGKMKLQAALQNIVPFVKSIVTCFESLALQNNVELTFQVEADDISLYFDPEKLERILNNLLANAFNYTPGGGKIAVSIRTAAGTAYPSGYVEIAVYDTGAGIPADQLEHIFDRFYRGEGSHEYNHSGTGIGLALSKELVELHHGQIEVHSSCRQDHSRGTEFILHLPMGNTHLQPGEITNKTVDIKTAFGDQGALFEKTAPWTPAKTFVNLESGAQTAKESEPGAGIPEEVEKDIVLLVEDNADMRSYMRGALEPHFNVKEAGNGKEGIRIAGEIIPDLVISDILMPETDGLELCDRLKKDIKTSHIPVILLTAKASEKSMAEGLETGADDYITKPFNTDLLVIRVRNLIRLRRQLQQKIQQDMMLQPGGISVSSIDTQFLKEIQAVIEKNLSDSGFNVEQLAQKLYLSPVTLRRKVEALTGDPPNRLIRSYRLKRAVQLLKSNFGNVTDVSFAVGFSSTAYFTKCFREKFHQLPHTYISD